MLKRAGHTALGVLRQTKQRAKLGTLHLPVDLHPLRQKPIVLSAPPPDQSAGEKSPQSVAEPSLMETPETAPRAGVETRALRSRLAVAERRILRLRQSLERERQARAQAAAALARPQLLIDHLVSDLRHLDSNDPHQLRRTVTAVLQAYGFETTPRTVSATARSRQPQTADELPSLPGWDRARLQAAVQQIQSQRSEIGGRQMIIAALQSLVRHRTVTVASVAAEAGLTSGLAKHRLRLALEGLCVVGIARHDGQRFSLIAPREDS